MWDAQPPWNVERVERVEPGNFRFDHGIFMDFLMGQLVKLLASLGKIKIWKSHRFPRKIIYFNGGSSFLCSSTTDSSATKSIKKKAGAELKRGFHVTKFFPMIMITLW